MQNMSTGGCLCGGVRFEVRGKIRDVINCHCKICRVFHGDQVGCTSASVKDLVFTSERTLKWYHSTDFAKRGFCENCGASMLFWDKNNPEAMGIAIGCMDEPTGVKVVQHIYVASAGDYYEINDDLPKLAEE
ncbi:GFA family protein [Sneathiella glossodoripedis]|uniref:GFA family protein n=1 Tax=Sneathiella glossodoripedis TaxID=418853 RepID=UPI00056866FF|nr:GFA family protein [Sneathiella glossodoripedis]